MTPLEIKISSFYIFVNKIFSLPFSRKILRNYWPHFVISINDIKRFIKLKPLSLVISTMEQRTG